MKLMASQFRVVCAKNKEMRRAGVVAAVAPTTAAATAASAPPLLLLLLLVLPPPVLVPLLAYLWLYSSLCLSLLVPTHLC